MNAASKKTDERFGVLLLQMGGPGSLEEIEPYLHELFLDPDIVQLPLGFLYRKRLARFIAKKRADKVRRRYEMIGGVSPVKDETEKQARGLEKILGLPVHFAMRYTDPRVEDAIKILKDQGVERLVVIPLYPQYSIATTGSAVHDFKKRKDRTMPYLIMESHYDHPGFIEALTEILTGALNDIDDSPWTHILFTAHSIPERYTRKGDPYVEQTERTAELVFRRAETDLGHSLAFHSSIGPVKWHGPTLGDELERIIAKGVKRLVVQPVSFVSENLETLYNLDIEFKNKCLEAGIEKFVRIPALGDSGLYLKALADMALAAVKEKRWESGND